MKTSSTLFLMCVLVGCRTPRPTRLLTAAERDQTVQVTLRAPSLHTLRALSQAGQSTNIAQIIVLEDGRELVPLKQEPHPMTDRITTSIIVNPQMNRYWLVRSGGVAGTYEEIGPIQIKPAQAVERQQ